MPFLRAYAYLIGPVFLLGMGISFMFELPFGFFGVLVAALVFCTFPAAFVSWFSDKAGSLASVIYTGSRQNNLKDQYSGNLTRARVLKISGKYPEALALVEEYIDKVPDDSEALLLKAQVFLDSGGNLSGARLCLEAVVQKAAAGDPHRRWALELIDKIKKQKGRPV